MAKKTGAVGQAQTNPTKLEYPTDQYGITSDFKKAVARLGLSVRGDPEKLAVVLGSFEVATQYIQARFNEDRAVRDAAIAAAAAEQSEPEATAEESQDEEDTARDTQQ